MQKYDLTKFDIRETDTSSPIIKVPPSTSTKKKIKVLKNQKTNKNSNSTIENSYNGFMSIFVISSKREVIHASKNAQLLSIKKIVRFGKNNYLEINERRANQSLIDLLIRVEENQIKVGAPIVWTDVRTGIKFSCSMIPVEVSTVPNFYESDKRISRTPFACLVFEELGTSIELCHSELKKNFALTKSEIELVEALYVGKELSTIALEKNITLNTIRDRLKTVFMKTNTNRQVNLVRMLRLFAK